MAAPANAVIITVVDGKVDYVATGDVAVEMIDLSTYTDTSFPDDVTCDMVRLAEFPAMPWRDDLLRQLRNVRDDLEASLVTPDDEHHPA